jgi:5-methylcytosine-specific restriction enzyme A
MSIRGQPTKWDKWYSTARWARIRKHQLLAHPLCHFCLENHVEPHQGDVNKFWLGPFRSLCKRCHDSAKKFAEARGYRPDIGLDGWPLDPNHPVYRTR